MDILIVRDQPLAVGKLPSDLLGRLIVDYVDHDPAVIVGPGVGSDAAAIDLGDSQIVVKTDPITFATDAAPHYLVNVNANDLACMGATPRWLLVTALLPEGKTTEINVERLFRDLQVACRERGVSLVGGHTEVTYGLDRPILVGLMIGTPGPSGLLKPGQAKPGDVILMTKSVALEGTALLARECGDVLVPFLGDDLVRRAASLLESPGISVVSDAQLLLGTGAVTALHDPTEGGVATGIRELAEASRCGAVIQRQALPLLHETSAIAAQFGIDPMGLLASGSLLAAIRPDRITEVLAACDNAGIQAVAIGHLTDTSGRIDLVDEKGTQQIPCYTSDEVSRALKLADQWRAQRRDQ